MLNKSIADIMKKIIFLFFVLFFSLSVSQNEARAQVTRIAVLPFQNMDGLMELNIWCYKLQDSVAKALLEKDPNSEHYQIVPADSIDLLLADLNLDPTNPQYKTDMWKVVKSLNVEKVVTGNFNLQAKRILINAYIYDVATKLPDPHNQARDIFKKKTDVMEAVPRIIRKLLPGLIK